MHYLAYNILLCNDDTMLRGIYRTALLSFLFVYIYMVFVYVWRAQSYNTPSYTATSYRRELSYETAFGYDIFFFSNASCAFDLYYRYSWEISVFLFETRTRFISSISDRLGINKLRCQRYNIRWLSLKRHEYNYKVFETHTIYIIPSATKSLIKKYKTRSRLILTCYYSPLYNTRSQQLYTHAIGKR